VFDPAVEKVADSLIRALVATVGDLGHQPGKEDLGVAFSASDRAADLRVAARKRVTTLRTRTSHTPGARSRIVPRMGGHPGAR